MGSRASSKTERTRKETRVRGYAKEEKTIRGKVGTFET